MNTEPIRKCKACRGEGIVTGSRGPRICAACTEGKVVVGLRSPDAEEAEALGVADTLRPRAWFQKQCCSCNRLYDALAWPDLPLECRLAIDGRLHEIRYCECGGSMRIELDDNALGTNPIVKQCGCGRAFDAEAWRELPFSHTFSDGDGWLVEQRHCPCRNTLAILLARSA